MTSIPLALATPATAARSTYDVIIVGAGISGLTLAAELSRRDNHVRVLIVDAGPIGPLQHLDSTDAGSTGAFDRWCRQTPDDYAFVRRSAHPDQWESTGRRVVGGRGLYWGGALVRIDPLEFETDSAARRWLSETGIAEPGGGYERAERLFESVGYFDHGGRSAPAELAESTTSFVTCPRACRSDQGRFEIFSPWALFTLDEKPRALSLLSQCEVQRLEPRGSHVRVTFGSGSQRSAAAARRVVLAAGTLENASILRSALGSADLELSVEDHLVAGAAVLLDRSAISSISHRLLENALYISRRHSGQSFNLFASLSRSHKGLIFDVWGMAEADPDTRAVIRFEGNAGAIRDISARKSDPALQTEKNMIAAARNVIGCLSSSLRTSLRANERCGETRETMRSMFYGDAAFNEVSSYASLLGTVDHEACLKGLPQQEWPWQSGMAEVFLAGPSSFERMGTANPTLTSVAWSCMLADRIS